MSDILRQLTANLIPTVSGGAYQDARAVSIVWNTRRKHRFLPKFRCRMHQTRPSTLFSPVFSLARERIGPPEARQKRPRRNEPPQATSLILCARFFLSKPQTEFAVWVSWQISNNLSVSAAPSQHPYPFCPFGTFPPDRGNRPLGGEPFRSGCGRGTGDFFRSAGSSRRRCGRGACRRRGSARARGTPARTRPQSRP